MSPPDQASPANSKSGPDDHDNVAYNLSGLRFDPMGAMKEVPGGGGPQAVFTQINDVFAQLSLNHELGYGTAFLRDPPTQQTASYQRMFSSFTVPTQMAKRDTDGAPYLCGPKVCIMVNALDPTLTVTGARLYNDIAAAADLITLAPSFASLRSSLSNWDWKRLGKSLNNIFSLGEMEGWQTATNLILPSKVESVRAAFWARGWLLVHTLSQMESAQENTPNTCPDPVELAPEAGLVHVEIWPFCQSLTPDLINARTRRLILANRYNWPVFVGEEYGWEAVSVLRACASGAPFTRTHYYQFPIGHEPPLEMQSFASRVKFQGRDNTASLIVISDELYQSTQAWPVLPTLDTNFRVDANESYAPHRLPSGSRAARVALMTSAINAHDRCAAMDGLYVATLLSFGSPIYLPTVSMLASIESLAPSTSCTIPQNLRVAKPSTNPGVQPFSRPPVQRYAARRLATLTEPDDESEDEEVWEARNADEPLAVSLFVNGFHNGCDISVPKDVMRPPLALLFSAQSQSAEYSLIEHHDWDLCLAASEISFEKLCISMNSVFGAARADALVGKSATWLDVAVGGNIRLSPLLKDVYNPISMATVQQLFGEDLQLGKESTPSPWTKRAECVLRRSTGITTPTFLLEGVNLSRALPESRLEYCLIHYRRWLNRQAYGPDQILPFASCLTYTNPFILNSDRLDFSKMKENLKVNACDFQIDTKLFTKLVPGSGFDPEFLRTLYLNMFSSQTDNGQFPTYQISRREALTMVPEPQPPIRMDYHPKTFVDSRRVRMPFVRPGAFPMFIGRRSEFQYYKSVVDTVVRREWWGAEATQVLLNHGHGYGDRVADFSSAPLLVARPVVNAISSADPFLTYASRKRTRINDHINELASIEQQVQEDKRRYEASQARMRLIQQTLATQVPTTVNPSQIQEAADRQAQGAEAAKQAEILRVEQLQVEYNATEAGARDSQMAPRGSANITTTMQPPLITGIVEADDGSTGRQGFPSGAGN